MSVWLVLDRGREVLGISMLLLWRRGRWRSKRGSSRWRGDSISRLHLYAGRALVNPLPSPGAFLCKVALLFAHIAKQIGTALYLKTIYLRIEKGVFNGVLEDGSNSNHLQALWSAFI